MRIALASLLFLAGFVSLIVFFTLWIIRKVYDKRQLRSFFGLSALSSLGVMILSIVLITSTPTPERVVQDITDRGSQITGLKTTEQKEIEEKEEIEKEKESAKKEAAEALKVENEQKELEQLAAKEAEEKAKSENTEAEELAKEQAAKVSAEQDKEEKGVTPIFYAKDIANKREAEVEKLLGEPAVVEKGEMPFNGITKGYKVNSYKNEKIEVMFIENRSVNIILNLTEKEFFTGNDEKKNLEYLDLPAVDLEKPIVEGQASVGAYGVEGFYRVEVGKWRGTNEGFVFVFTEKKYKF